MNDEHSRSDDDVAYQLAQLLKEAALQKRAERQQIEREHAAPPPSSKWARFWGWWRDYGGSFSTLVAVLSIAVGALWTVNQFLVQQREQVAQRQREVELQRHSSIAQFAADLADPTKRNAAAYAVAVLAREDATPLLRQHLIESAASSEDASFRDALVQALLTVGASALPAMADLNREADAKSPNDSASSVLLRATSAYLAAVLSGRVQGIAADTHVFAGSHLRGVRLARRELDSLNLSGVSITESNLCRASLRHATLTNASFHSTTLIGVDMSGSKLHRADFFGGNDLHSIRLDGSEGDSVSFEGAAMELSSLRNAVLR
ncbi:MAG TPA: pentapeptide repeat-containing protein, partial [Longimicrobiaceae bacterium]|nr:pentapeptide repeat-containing protein [Longimicrobiaceae bacterium]